MTLVFLIMLVTMFFINVQITKNIFHPTVIFKIPWIISTFILLFIKETWGVELSFDTVMIFLGGFIFFDLGYFFFSLTKKGGKKHVLTNKLNIIKMNRSVTLLLTTFFLSLLLVYSISKLMGGFGSLINDLMAYRSIKYSGDGSTTIQSFLFRIIEVMGLASYIFYLREKDYISKSRRYIYTSTIAIAVGTQLISSGRMRILAIFIQFLAIFYVSKKKNGFIISFKNQLIMLRKSVAIIAIFIVFFFVFGSLFLNKVDENPFNTLAVYTSSGIAAFELTWRQNSFSNDRLGGKVFSPVYNITDRIFGRDNSSTPLETRFRTGRGFSTNIYTLYHEQIQDFGPYSVPIIMALLGFFISYLESKSRREDNIGFWTAVYSLNIYGLFMSFYKDYFFTNSTYLYITIAVLFIIFKTEIICSYMKPKNIV